MKCSFYNSRRGCFKKEKREFKHINIDHQRTHSRGVREAEAKSLKGVVVKSAVKGANLSAGALKSTLIHLAESGQIPVACEFVKCLSNIE